MANQQMNPQESTAPSSNLHPPSSNSSLFPTPYSLLHSHPGLLLAIGVYLLLALCYFFIVPIFEAPDEWTHTGHVKHIAEGKGLPVMLPGQGIYGGQQPPLYYVGGALLVQPFELDSFGAYLKAQANPHSSMGYALDPGNKNNFLHTPAEAFPYQGLSLTVHILRLYSMLFGLVALIFTYFTATEIYDFGFTIYDDSPRSEAKRDLHSPPHSPFTIHHSPFTIHFFATAVALFVACQPMFAFITASVANEPANMALCAIGLWLAQRYVLRGPAVHWGRAAALGVTLSLISLAKMTGLSFGLVTVVAFLIAAVSTRKKSGAARLLWRDGVIIGLLALMVGGWWYWRNYQLYGDFFQRELYKIYFNIEQKSLTLSEFLYTLSTGEVSFWATFGWLNLVAPDWLYIIYRVVSRVGLLGVAVAVAVQAVKRLGIGDWRLRFNTPPPLPALIIHLVFPVALAFSLTRLVAIEGGLQGRQLLPALGSMAIVIMWGWWQLTPPRWRIKVTGTLMVGLFGLALWLPFGVVAPEYIPKPLLTEADLPADLHRLDWVYQDELKLVGVKLGAESVHPGERVPVTVYWQALKPMETNYSVFVHLIGRAYQTVGQFNSYPGLGLRPTRTLQPGEIVADTYPVLVDGGSTAPTRLLVEVGLFDFKEAGRPGLQAVDPNGQPVGPTVGQLKLIPWVWPPAPPGPPLAEFADSLQLGAYALEGCQSRNEGCQIIFTWLPQGQPATDDYTVFIQLWQGGQPVAGFDTPPLTGDYVTGLWAAGEVIVDPHRLDLTQLPPGEYQIWAGLYNAANGERLAASANGTPLADYALNLGSINLK